VAQIKDISITLNPGVLKNALGSGPSIARMMEDIDWAAETLNREVRPKVVFDYFTVTSGEEQQITLAGPDGGPSVLLNPGRRFDLLAKAELALVAVTTLGPIIDEIRRELQKSKADLKAYIWDMAAVLALGLTGNEIKHFAEKEAARRGWGVGRRLGPGDLKGWALEEQRLLCSLLPIESIGVSMTSGTMLSPVKSASSVIGIGPANEETEVGTICEWCHNRKSCPIRWLEEPLPGSPTA
jgi:hypothetical protein